MNADWIIPVFVVIDDVLDHLDHVSHAQAGLNDAEILTIAVVAAKYFQNHHERAINIMYLTGYVSKSISTSRFSRRLHALADWLPFLAETLAALWTTGDAFIIDSIPVPVCRRVRARRCRKVRGRIYCGYCSAKKETFFGWRLHLICAAQGLPVRFVLLPASLHDLTPIHELTYDLPQHARVFADKAYNSKTDEQAIAADVAVRLIPIRRKNMLCHAWDDAEALREQRHTIETVNSQLEKMGIQRLHARTNQGFSLKVYASLMALMFSNL